MNNNQTIEDKRQILIHFLNIYLSKKELKMKGLIRNVKGLLEKDQPITIKQFLAFIKFIEREKPFKGTDRDQIVRYFSPIIKFPKEEFINEYPTHY
jgi:hypothetical protein